VNREPFWEMVVVGAVVVLALIMLAVWLFTDGFTLR
jgi:hypothetical protein